MSHGSALSAAESMFTAWPSRRPSQLFQGLPNGPGRTAHKLGVRAQLLDSTKAKPLGVMLAHNSACIFEALEIPQRLREHQEQLDPLA